MNSRDKIKELLIDNYSAVVYTYYAHWMMVDKYKARSQALKITSIVLTAMSTVGFITFLSETFSFLSWVPIVTSALALGLNLYSLNFNIDEKIKQHKNAAQELWDVREAYEALFSDFDDLTIEAIRDKRKELTDRVGVINKSYFTTDKREYEKARKMRVDEIKKYV